MNKPPESRVRLLIVPGLNNSGLTHWQSWLQARCTWVASSSDPWMAFERSRYWAQRWACRWLNLGAAGAHQCGYGVWAAAVGCTLGEG